jgi:hypothetical protein
MIKNKEEFLALDQDEQIETFKKMRIAYKISEIVEAWDLKNPANLYGLLRRIRIYQDVVRLNNVPSLDSQGQKDALSSQASNEAATAPTPTPPAYAFSYALNRDDLSGSELADIFDRLASYLRQEPGIVSISLKINN